MYSMPGCEHAVSDYVCVCVWVMNRLLNSHGREMNGAMSLTLGEPLVIRFRSGFVLKHIRIIMQN